MVRSILCKSEKQGCLGSLMKYDWKLLDGGDQLESLKAHDFIFHNQKATLLTKTRQECLKLENQICTKSRADFLQ